MNTSKQKYRRLGIVPLMVFAIGALVALSSCDSEPPEPPEPPPVPDLTLRVSNGLDGPVEPGQEILYRLSYANVGDTVATDVVMTKTVPVGTSFDAAQSDTAWSCTGPEAGSTCTFTVDSLPPNTSGEVVFAVRVDENLDEGIDAIGSETRISEASGTADPTRDNNTVAEMTSVAPKPPPPPPRRPVLSGEFCKACVTALSRGWIDSALVADYQRQCNVCS